MPLVARMDGQRCTHPELSSVVWCG